MSVSPAARAYRISADASNLAQLSAFCRQMGHECRQGEIGLVSGDEYVAIRDFSERL